MRANTEISIWERIVGPSWAELPPTAARGLLKLNFNKRDVTRMNQLAAIAREGSLSELQSKELEEYLHVGRVLTIMHSHARRYLKGKASGPSATRRKVS